MAGDVVTGAKHASAMRTAFAELDISAFFCIQGIPTVAILFEPEPQQPRIDHLHKSLWNQGLASLLLIISTKEVRAYSLISKPIENFEKSKDKRLIEILDLVTDSLEVLNLIPNVESGRYFINNAACFSTEQRVDNVLLGNLVEVHKRLIALDMTPSQTEALLMQIMFLAYLEDRQIVTPDYIKSVSNDDNVISLETLLKAGNVKLFNALFNRLNRDFNGDLFLSPCSFEQSKECEITAIHLDLLWLFRSGMVELESGQGRFWPYDFSFIPVELISAVYDRFLGIDPEDKRRTGAFYTPSFLASLTVNQSVEIISHNRLLESSFLAIDPSCGSGIFLVQLFERIVEVWRLENNEEIPTWEFLISTVLKINGQDKDKRAVRVAAFSLYIALLEQADSQDISTHLKNGKLLPTLMGNSLRALDFFDGSSAFKEYDLIIGNPPWVSRKHQENKSALDWCQKQKKEIPGKEVAWAFAWKSLEHLKPNGIVAFLLPAMGFLVNHNKNTVNTRSRWMKDIRFERVINFSDLRYQLFESAIRPTALCVYRPRNEGEGEYRFDYWCPKADLHLRNKRLITLSSADYGKVRSDEVIRDYKVLKRYLWMKNPDLKLFSWLDTLPKLHDRTQTYREKLSERNEHVKKWIIGKGFERLNPNSSSINPARGVHSNIIGSIPHLDNENLSRWTLPNLEFKPFPDSIVRRRGVEEVFEGPHVLISRGVTASGRLRCAYVEESMTFLDGIYGLSFPSTDVYISKLLTVILNSSLASWFLFHSSASPGMERPEIKGKEMLQLPFPLPEECQNPVKAKNACDEIVSIIDQLHHKDETLQLETSLECLEAQFDQLVYQYYGLDDSEIHVIEDFMKFILPSVQPAKNSYPPLWKVPSEEQQICYADSIISSIQEWLDSDFVTARLYRGASDLALIRLTVTPDKPDKKISIVDNDDEFNETLRKIRRSLPRNLSSNFQLYPDLRIFINDDLYLVKPKTVRFWLRTTAQDDADALAAELYSFRSSAEGVNSSL